MAVVKKLGVGRVSFAKIQRSSGSRTSRNPSNLVPAVPPGRRFPQEREGFRLQGYSRVFLPSRTTTTPPNWSLSGTSSGSQVHWRGVLEKGMTSRSPQVTLRLVCVESRGERGSEPSGEFKEQEGT